jgi:hypothetical protein
MAKDPAFLFYSSDFLTGTQFFTDEQTGKYIKLLCLQHQQGHLNLKDMLKICKRQDKDIFRKFKKDENGLFFNERLESEVVKRNKYSKSRSENRKKKNISTSYVQHMENENENTDNTIQVIPRAQDFVGMDIAIIRPPNAPTMEDVRAYFFGQGKTDPQEAATFFNHFEGLGWRKGITPIMSWRSFANNWIANPLQFDRKKNTQSTTVPYDPKKIMEERSKRK